MSKSMKGMQAEAIRGDVSKSGFYLYEDGYSCWGINILRFSNSGVEITEELHKKPVAEKVAWYKEDQEKKAEAFKASEEERKAKEAAAKA